MDFEREALKETLDVAKLAIDQREFIPILAHFCFSGKHVTTYNDLIGIQVALNTNFVCALQASTLLRLVNSVSAEKISLGFSDKTVYFKTGIARKGVRARLPYMEEQDFFFKWPSMKRLEALTMDTLQADTFVKALDLCLSSVGDQQPAQMGVTLHDREKGLTLYSTNNKAISRFQTDIKWGVFNHDILPTAFCRAIIKGAETYGIGSITVSKGKDFVIVCFGDKCKMYGKLISNKDPLDFEKVINEHVSKTHKKDRQKFDEDLRESFNRCLIILTSELTKSVNVTVDQKVVQIEARSSVGKIKSSAEFKKSWGPKMQKFKMDAELSLKAIESTDSIFFGKNSVVFSKGDYMHLLGTQPAE